MSGILSEPGDLETFRERSVWQTSLVLIRNRKRGTTGDEARDLGRSGKVEMEANEKIKTSASRAVQKQDNQRNYIWEGKRTGRNCRRPL